MPPSRQPPDLPALLEGARSPDPDVRGQAIAALGRAGDRRAVPDLIALLLTRDRALIWSVTAALARLGEEPFARALRGIWNGDFTPACTLRDARLVGPLIGALTSRYASVRTAAAVALGDLPRAECGEELLRALADPHPPVRRAAARSLGRLRPEGKLVVWRLLDALLSPDPYTRAEVARALGQLRRRAAVSPLIRLLTSDDDPDVLQAAAEALGLLGAEEAIAALVERLHEPQCAGTVKVAVIRALGALATRPRRPVRSGESNPLEPPVRTRVVAALVQHLGDAATNEASISAAQELGKVGDAGAIPSLQELLRWWEPSAVRNAAADAIQAIRHRAGAHGTGVTPAEPPHGRGTEVAS